MRRGTALVLLLVAALVLAGCGKPAATQVEVTIKPGYRFAPGAVTVKAGEPVTLKIKNMDAMLHDFTVDKIEVADKTEKSSGSHPMEEAAPSDLHVAVAANAEGVLDFTPKKAGSYTFYCTVPGHKDSGMTGTLVVT